MPSAHKTIDNHRRIAHVVMREVTTGVCSEVSWTDYDAIVFGDRWVRVTWTKISDYNGQWYDEILTIPAEAIVSVVETYEEIE